MSPIRLTDQMPLRRNSEMHVLKSSNAISVIPLFRRSPMKQKSQCLWHLVVMRIFTHWTPSIFMIGTIFFYEKIDATATVVYAGAHPNELRQAPASSNVTQIVMELKCCPMKIAVMSYSSDVFVNLTNNSRRHFISSDATLAPYSATWYSSSCCRDDSSMRASR